MSRLLHWLIRSICKQGRKGARLCSHGKEAFPSRTDGCLEAQGTSHILQVALWGQRDAPQVWPNPWRWLVPAAGQLP